MAMASGLTTLLPALLVLKERDYRQLWFVSLFWQVCRWMEIVTMAWLALELTNSPLQVALVGSCRWFPLLIIGLISGVVADRFSRRRVVVLVQQANLVITLGLLSLLLTDLARVWHLYIVSLLLGSAYAMDQPSRRSLVMDILGPKLVADGMSLEAVAITAGKIFAPILAGSLIAVVGAQGVYVFLSAAYVATILLALNVRAQPQHTRGPGQPMFSSLAEGLRYAGQHRVILIVLVITIVANLLAYPYVHMVPIVARDFLHVGPALMGLLIAAEGTGSLLGLIAIATQWRIRLPGRIYAVGAFIFLIALFLFGLSPWYAASYTLLLLGGVGAAGFMAMQYTILMLASASEVRGRVAGILTLCIGFQPFGALALGALASAFGAPKAIVIAGGTGALIMLLIILFTPVARQPLVPATPMEEQP